MQKSTQVLLLLTICALLAACSAGDGSTPQDTVPASTNAFKAEQSSAPPALPPTPLPPGGDWQEFVGINQVEGVAFAPDGSLWAATEGGLVRWDLAEDSYVQYTAGAGLASNQVMGVAFGLDGSLWAATLGGISRFHDGQWRTYTEADGLPSNAVRSIAVAPTGAVWAGTTEGAARWDGSNWASHFAGHAIWALDIAPDGATWLAVNGVGISRFDPEEGTWRTDSPDSGLPDQGVTALAVGPAGDVWAYVNWEGVWHLDAASALASGQETGASWEQAYESGLVCAVEDTGRETWLGTCGSTHYSNGDLVHGQAGTWSTVEDWSELGNPAIRSIAAGGDGLLAVGTEKGLSVRQAGLWRTLLGGPTRTVVTDVAVTPNGAAWLAFGDSASDPAGGGLSRFDGQDWQYYLGDANIQSLAVGPDGALWAGGGRWVARWAGGQWQEIAGADRLDGNVIDIAPASGDITWIATQFSVYRFDGQDWQTWPSLVPGAIEAGPDGTIWLSKTALSDTGCGLWYYGAEGWSELEGEAVCGVEFAVDPSGGLWLPATDGAGLRHYADGAWQSYPVPGLSPGKGFGLTVSAHGDLWLAYEQGLAQLAGDGWHFYQGPWRGVLALTTAPDGSLWLGTPTGAVRAWPQASPPATSPPGPTASQPVASSTPSGAQTQPSPTAVPAATDTPVPAQEPASTATPAAPEITSFEVSPAAVDPGDTVTLAWQAQGTSAELCPSSRYVLFTNDDCRPAALTGSTTFEIPPEAAGFQYVDFILTVERQGRPEKATSQVSVALKCERTWFFSDTPQAGICPREPVQSPAAAQRFERGRMIWLENPGRYYILHEATLLDDATRKRLDVINDPLEITRDTSAEVQAPPGLYAPVSGFGLIWRGDVAQSPGFRDALGWALAPEFAYEATWQCDDARPSGGRSWQTCYLQGPEDEVIALHPLGGWHLLGQP